MDGMDEKTTLFMIMLFYAVLSYLIFPGLGYFFMKKKEGITYGIVIGSIISIILWFQYGQEMVTIK